jgi:hypothetical protein
MTQAKTIAPKLVDQFLEHSQNPEDLLGAANMASSKGEFGSLELSTPRDREGSFLLAR